MLEAVGRSHGNLGWQPVELSEHWRADNGGIDRINKCLAADDGENARRLWITGRAAHAIEFTSPHSSARFAWNESASLISAFNSAACLFMAATSRASRRARSRRLRKSRRMFSINADRETFGPASLSRDFTKSSDSDREVFAFIPRLFYRSKIITEK